MYKTLMLDNNVQHNEKIRSGWLNTAPSVGCISSRCYIICGIQASSRSLITDVRH